jgi:hypothetical protein
MIYIVSIPVSGGDVAGFRNHITNLQGWGSGIEIPREINIKILAFRSIVLRMAGKDK